MWRRSTSLSSILLWVRTDQPRQTGMNHWNGPHSGIISPTPGAWRSTDRSTSPSTTRAGGRRPTGCRPRSPRTGRSTASPKSPSNRRLRP
ncbi:hypothetical protein DMA15_30135 [Streptomyces sp. WAC 01529]|nr:hypothetical protein DMA15_30135 [Streptomyces sp. WAC 01529]